MLLIVCDRRTGRSMPRPLRTNTSMAEDLRSVHVVCNIVACFWVEGGKGRKLGQQIESLEMLKNVVDIIWTARRHVLVTDDGWWRLRFPWAFSKACRKFRGCHLKKKIRIGLWLLQCLQSWARSWIAEHLGSRDG